jgi:hypothetical protein
VLHSQVIRRAHFTRSFGATLGGYKYFGLNKETNDDEKVDQIEQINLKKYRISRSRYTNLYR